MHTKSGDLCQKPVIFSFAMAPALHFLTISLVVMLVMSASARSITQQDSLTLLKARLKGSVKSVEAKAGELASYPGSARACVCQWKE